MKENDNAFIEALYSMIDNILDSGAEVHVVDKSNPNRIVEHVFNSDKDWFKDEDTSCDDDDIPFCDSDFYYDEKCNECMATSCATCPYGDEDMDYEPDMWGIPDIDRVVFNDPATIIFWVDGTKTIVKCMDGERFERYAGFAAACMKKMFGSTSRAKAVMESLAVDQPPKLTKERVDSPVVTDKNMHETIMEAVNEALER